MNSRKPIDIGASAALIELKAELHRKQGELKSQATDRGVCKSLRVKNDPKGAVKLAGGKNHGIEKRSDKDVEQDQLAAKTYEKARYVLEAKAKLYDEMNANALSFDEEHPVLTNSLVDFQRKAIDRVNEDRLRPPVGHPPKNSKGVGDEKWTEFTDSLGRTRRVLKSELAAYKAADKEFKESFQDSEGPSEVSLDEIVRQQKHQKWEQQAAELADKSKVHYQDILFDEIREHGTGYYGFSKDDEQRAVQLSQLKKLSQETAASRKKIEIEKKGKKAEMKERLRKIRARRRAKLGLPPEEEESESEEEEEGKEKSESEEEKGTKVEKKSELSRPSDLRAWDFGKPGVYGPQPTNFDELDAKWLKDRRSDRKSEFAPPSAYSKPSSSSSGGAGSSSSSSIPKYQNFVKAEAPPPGSVTTKRTYEPIPASSQRPQRIQPIRDELPAPTHPSSPDFERGRRTEVAPPPTYEYYHGETKRQRTSTKPASQEAVSEAINQGIENFRKKMEEQRQLSRSGQK